MQQQYAMNPFTGKLDRIGEGDSPPGGGITTINSNSGGSSASVQQIFSSLASSGGSVSFSTSGAVHTLNLTDERNNTTLGKNSGSDDATGQYNVSIGVGALDSLGTGEANIAIGQNALGNLVDSSYNIGIGNAAGSSYTDGSELGNICIGNSGVAGDYTRIRIGNSSYAGCQIGGIYNVSEVPNSQVVGVDNQGNLSNLGDFVSNTYINSFITIPVTLTSNTPINLASMSLPAGTYQVSAMVQFSALTPVTVSGVQQISLTDLSAEHSTLGIDSIQSGWQTSSFALGPCPLTIPGLIVSNPFGPTITLNLVVSGIFSAGSMAAQGRITAIRLT
jgi:hypothetical protein